MNYLEMKINECICKHYEELKTMCSDDKAVDNGKTEMDIYHNVLITAINKYKDKDITDEDGFAYIKKSLLMEKKFQYHRTDKTIVFTDTIEDYANRPN